MKKYSLIALFAVFNVFLLVEAAPRALDATALANLSAIADIEARVRYDGAQLWSVTFSDEKSQRVVISLKRDFG